MEAVTTRQTPVFVDSQVAFEDAIAAGVLSVDKTRDNYAGRYMYMDSGYDGERHNFKHSCTRRYISSPRRGK